MGFLSNRFTFNSKGNPFHSSGVVNDSGQGETLGSTSAESFEKRREIDHNRQHVNRYGEAQVVHGYRTQAVDSGDLTTSRISEEEHGQRSKRHSSQTIPRTSRIDDRGTSRVDVVKRVDPRNAEMKPTFGYQPRARGADTPVRPVFREPSSRGFNPYK